MSDEQIRFTVDPSSLDGYLPAKGDAVIAALTARVTSVNVALQAKTAGHKLQGNPTQNDGSKITGGVQGGGGPAFYLKFLEDGTAGPYTIVPKDPKGVLAF